MSNDNLRKKYVRVLIEVEVEVLDDTALRAESIYHEKDLPDFPGSAQAQDVGYILTTAMIEGIDQPGVPVKYMSSGVLPRRISEDGSQYEEFTFPALPTRNDDGSLTDEA